MTLCCAVPPPPTNVTYIQECATTLNVSWSPPTPLEDVTGYMIYYSDSDGSGGSVSISNGLTEGSATYPNNVQDF